VSGHLNLDVFLYKTGTVQANSLNYHLSASVIFLR
jgi:hypothetical protein